MDYELVIVLIIVISGPSLRASLNSVTLHLHFKRNLFLLLDLCTKDMNVFFFLPLKFNPKFFLFFFLFFFKQHRPLQMFFFSCFMFLELLGLMTLYTLTTFILSVIGRLFCTQLLRNSSVSYETERF